MIGSKEIGLKFQTSDLLASLGMGTMFECFKVLGITPNFKEWLNIAIMGKGGGGGGQAHLQRCSASKL